MEVEACLCILQQCPVLVLVSEAQGLACTDGSSALMTDTILVAGGF